MFDELSIYTQKGHFFFKPTDVLSKVCNAPENAVGIFRNSEMVNTREQCIGLKYIANRYKIYLHRFFRQNAAEWKNKNKGWWYDGQTD